MIENTTLTVNALPRVLPLYAKALGRRPGFVDGDQLPAIAVDWPVFEFDSRVVEAYAEVCQWPLERDQVPLLFPHSFFGPLHLLMLTDPRFPLKLLGAVHQRNHVIQQRPLTLGRRYAAALALTAARRRPQGLEVDFTTEISDGERVLWQSLTTFLFRTRFKGEDPESPLARVVQNLEQSALLVSYPVPDNIGKRFGRITRDINPIHMSKTLARLFGFERDLCHGMWALSRSLPSIEGIDYTRPVRNDVLFKGPLYLGRDISVRTAPERLHHFELYSGASERPCVVSTIDNVADGSMPASPVSTSGQSMCGALSGAASQRPTQSASSVHSAP